MYEKVKMKKILIPAISFLFFNLSFADKPTLKKSICESDVQKAIEATKDLTISKDEKVQLLDLAQERIDCCRRRKDSYEKRWFVSRENNGYLKKSLLQFCSCPLLIYIFGYANNGYYASLFGYSSLYALYCAIANLRTYHAKEIDTEKINEQNYNDAINVKQTIFQIAEH